jgi:(1->4)-alpha-D-glucan 1-alpha-D-glucosylmutase
VYRTYVTGSDPISDHDRRYIVEAVQCAKRRAPRVTGVVFDFIQKLLLKQTTETTPDACEERARFIGKFQQITSPVAAKGIEDTALYVHNRLVSLNEVGSDPTQFGIDPAALHEWMAARRARWPSALSATSTHDTKRGEDVRARLNVLSEIPGAWKAAVTRWRAVNRRFKVEVRGAVAPDPNEEYLIYQTLVGAWPFETDDGARMQVIERLAAYMTKALREAKVHTSWLSPDEEYEHAVTRFVRAILDRRRPNVFLHTFRSFQARVAEAGIYNSLAQLLVKITAPGVPDFYQGTELWDLTLVDPDNRRPVDYEARRQALSGLKCCPTPADVAALVDSRRDGRIKMFVMNRALAARAALRHVYEEGDYIALQTAGVRRDCLFAFARADATGAAITCVPRLVTTLGHDAGSPPLGRSVWSDTRIQLPRDLSTTSFRNVFTGATIEPERMDEGSAIAAATLFEQFPVALLTAVLPSRPPGRPSPPPA